MGITGTVGTTNNSDGNPGSLINPGGRVLDYTQAAKRGAFGVIPKTVENMAEPRRSEVLPQGRVALRRDFRFGPLFNCLWYERDPCGTPAPGCGICQFKIDHFGNLAQEAVDGFAKSASALAMDDADAQELAAPALGEIFRQEGGEIGGAKGVQVEFVRDGVMDDGFRILHELSMR